VDGEGVVGRRADERFGFTRLLLRLRLETDTANEALARQLAEQAEQTCLVSASLDLPTETMIEVKTTQRRESTIGKESSLAR
jgi:organic hydroperoxide reductase OsmC/OhrA